MDIQNDLSEREKELDCLYEIAKMLTGTAADRTSLASRIAESLRKAMTHPEETIVKIAVADEIFGPDTPPSLNLSSFTEEALLDSGEKVTVTIFYTPGSQPVEREKKLISSAASLIANAVSKSSYYSKLEEKSQELEAKNTALREVLYQIGREKEEYISFARQAAGTLLLPLIGELEDTALGERQTGLIRQLKLQLEAILGSQEEWIKELSKTLTPRELEICSLIKNGETTKDIAALLNISPQTVERHRNTIRKKLEINKKGTNLVLYLRNMY